MALLINAIVYGCRLIMNLDYVVKLLTFVNGKFCNEMLATRSLVRIDVIKEKMIKNELKMLVTIKLLKLCVF